MEEVYKTTPVQAAFSNPFASAFGNLMPASSAPAAPDPFVAAFGNLVAKPISFSLTFSGVSWKYCFA